MGQFRGFSWRVGRPLLAFALVGCSGGQSGTDADYDDECMADAGAAVDLEHAWLGLSLAEHVALLNNAWSAAHVPFVDNTDSNVLEPSVPPEAIRLELSVDAEGAVLHRFTGDEDCDGEFVSLDAAIQLKLGDAFEFAASGPVLELNSEGAYLYQTFCWDPETHQAFPASVQSLLTDESCGADRTAGELTLRLGYQPELSESGRYVLDGLGIHYWDSSTTEDYAPPPPVFEPPERHVPLPEVAEVCAEQESVAAGSFDTEADAMAAVIGTWALCDAERPWPFAGVEISSNGTWRAILGEGGELSVSQGFEREGSLRFWDTSEQNERPGFFQVDLIGPHWWFPAGAIFLSASGNTLDLSQSKLVRIAPAVDREPAPEAEAGELLGEAGCASAETDMQNIGTSTADVLRSLAGEYVGCAGLNGSLRFDTKGKVTVVGADGEELQTVSFTVGQTLDDNAVLTVGEETWHPVLSSRPVKLWIRRTSSSDFADLETWVLSARER